MNAMCRLMYLCMVLTVPLSALHAQEKPLEDLAFFENKIRPILVAHCYECHSENSEDIMGGLLLDSKQSIRKGGDSGPAVVPGSPETSLLLESITYRNGDLQMPPDSRLPKQVIDDFRDWIKTGATDPRIVKSSQPKPVFNLQERRHDHWAWHPLKKTREGETVDSIILEKLQKIKLDPTGPASPRELIRRMHFDLIGLPPTPVAIEAFEKEFRANARQAIGRLVDRLLEDPRFGEHWGRHWLDVIRFSETKGHVTDQEKPYAWKYRDYVISAFNTDLAYDQFIKEHLAGDLLPPQEIRAGPSGIQNQSVTATSALFMHEMHFMAVDPLKQRWDEINAQIDVVGKAFLGITTECARCHDHKFDAVSQADYYAMAGIFWSTELSSTRTSSRKKLNAVTAQDVKRLEADLANYLTSKRKQRRQAQNPKAGGNYFPISDELGIQSPNDTRQLMAKISAIEKLDPSWSLWTRAAKDVNGQDVQLLIRGEHRNKGKVIPRGFLEALAPAGIDTLLPNSQKQSSGRLWLAEQIAHRQNPLTARVWVNRIWHHLLGRGIVETPNNFGKLGRLPTHPKLLDYLARQLIDNGWSTKTMIRLIMVSQAYQRSSQVSNATFNRDPTNQFLAYRSKRRLTAEQLRDSMLNISGMLNPKMLGPSVDVFVPSYATGNKPSNIPKSGPLDGDNRRSIYIKVRRNYFDPFLQTFDFPDPGKSIGRRSISLVPNQSLAMLNSPLVHELAEDWGQKIISSKSVKNDTSRVRQMWRAAIGRQPTAQELKIAMALIAKQVDPKLQQLLKWKQVAHLLYNHPEFMWID
ncbi:MAG: PSD1 and planctomycete cytochrome C domain-containing protein [Planctomycetota bacterium]|nr:PSD1 and planctomycete cytochrome C domain-containing protein [Planctomycetota bacterium]